MDCPSRRSGSGWPIDCNAITPAVNCGDSFRSSDQLRLDELFKGFQRFGRCATHLTHGDPVGDVAEYSAGRLIPKPERHFRLAVRAVAQPDPAAQRNAGDAHPSQVAAIVEFDNLDQAADGHRADLPVHGIACTDATRLFVRALPALEVCHEQRIAIRVADYLPDRVTVGVDDASASDAHQPITGNRRLAASRGYSQDAAGRSRLWEPATRLVCGSNRWPPP